MKVRKCVRCGKLFRSRYSGYCGDCIYEILQRRLGEDKSEGRGSQEDSEGESGAGQTGGEEGAFEMEDAYQGGDSGCS